MTAILIYIGTVTYGTWKKKRTTQWLCQRDRLDKNKVRSHCLWVHENSWMGDEGINPLELKD